MSARARLAVLLSLLPLLMLLAPLAAGPVSAATTGPTIKVDMVQIIQGEVDTTAQADAFNDFYALKIMTFHVVPADTRVWASVPLDARNLTIWTPMGIAGSGTYGRESSGPMAGSIYVDIPSSFNYSSGDFSVHLSYGWTQEFSHGKTTIDVSEPLPYTANCTFLLWAYVLKGYNVTGTGLEMTFDQTGAMSYYPEKDLYINASASFNPTVDPSITITKPKVTIPWALYLGAAAIGIVIVIAFAYARYARPSGPAASSKPTMTEDQESLTPSRVQSDPSRKRELVVRKKEMLAEIEAIKSGLASGAVKKEDAEEELVRLRKEYKTIRNELNRISRSSREIAVTSGPAPSDSKRSDEFEIVLASLAKIDDDYERGRLPENSYNALRKDYLEKAATLMETESSPLEAIDPVEAEKVKLMEAIIALDDEHGRGDIDARVYEDLRSSYKSELAALMKKEDERD